MGKKAVISVFVLFVLTAFVCGCSSSRKNYILSETEQYYYIPAGTPFKAVIIKGEPPREVIRDKDTWAVDAGYLAKIQEEANANVLNLPK